jgi:glutamyl-tRNA synthetase
MLQFFFTDPVGYSSKQLVPKGRDATQTREALTQVSAALQPLSDWSVEALEPALRSTAERLGWPARDLFMTLRVAITGRTVTPPLIESMSHLGKAPVLDRLTRAGRAISPTDV